MRVFVAGATGVIGRALVPKLRAAGHTVIAMTRSEEGADALRKTGIEAEVSDALDERAVLDAIRRARPEAVIHQLTALPRRMNPRKIDREARETNRLRVDGTRNLIAGAKAAGARRFIAQSIAFVTRPEGAAVHDETAPIYADAPEIFRGMMDAVASLEEQTVSARGLTGVVLRYGFFYGPGTVYDEHEAIAEGIDRRR
ncbi:MAG: NAD(P)-dependent oxidoreductase, partial [Polyangiaceae bacterium]